MKGYIKLGTHNHTSEHSPCSTLISEELIRFASEKKLEGVVITEHHRLWNKKEIEDLKKKSN